MRTMTEGVIPGVLASLLLAGVSQAEASPVSAERVRQAFSLAYALDFTGGNAALAEAALADPADPAPPRAIAALAWVEMLFYQGVATYEAFTGDVSSSDVARPMVPPALKARFEVNLTRARRLSQQRLDARERDGDYQMGATDALSALYKSTVEGRTLGALADGRRAVKAMQRARVLEPDRPEPAVILGMYRYVVASLAWPLRLLAGAAGLSGSRDQALALLREASMPGSVSEADALVLLMVIYNRENRRGVALAALDRLQALFPGNRLFALNAATTALEARQPLLADRQLSIVLEGAVAWAAPKVEGEPAMWLWKRGVARVALGRLAEARGDLARSLIEPGRDWVRGRTHLELARIAVAEADTAGAREHLEQAVTFCERGADALGVRLAKELLKTITGQRPPRGA